MSSVGFYIYSFEVEIYSTFITLVSFSTGANVSPRLFTILASKRFPCEKLMLQQLIFCAHISSKATEKNSESFVTG